MGVTVDTKRSAALRVNIHSDIFTDNILWIIYYDKEVII